MRLSWLRRLREIVGPDSHMKFPYVLLGLLTLTTGAHLLTRIPQWHFPMFGDDFLLVRDASMPIREGSLLTDMWQTGSGKWRPLSTVVLLWLAREWGFVYGPYQILNSVLLISCAVLGGLLAFRLTRTFPHALLVSTAYAVSHLTWMAQSSVYGTLELLTLFLFLCSVHSVVSLVSSTNRTEKYFLLSLILLLLATFTHERYLFCIIPLVAATLLHPSQSQLRRRAWIPLLIPLIHVILKSFMLGLNPLTTGGESQRQVGTWVLRHIADSALMLTGWHSGVGVFYSHNSLFEQRTNPMLGIVTLATIAGVTILLVIRRSDISSQSRPVTAIQLLVLVGFAVSSLLPAALVHERIEARWLMAPHVMMLVLGVSVTLLHGGRGRLILGLAIPALSIAASTYWSKDVDRYLQLRNQPSLAMSLIEDHAPRNGPWVLTIVQSDQTVPVAWQFGYTQAFRQLRNPPYLAQVGFGLSQACPILRVKIPCVSLQLNGLDIARTLTISTTRTTPISLQRE